MKTTTALLSFIVLIFSSIPAFACSSCGCTLSPEWVSEGQTHKPGWKLDFRYDFIAQSDLRRGSSSVSKGAFPLPNANEIQLDTRTSFYTAAADYTSENNWGVRIEAPFIDRYHTTIAPGDLLESASERAGLGDMRIVGRYHGFWDGLTGVQLGVKLPTGATQQNFKSGPQTGALLDRGLQLGTGTTDVIAGVYNMGFFGGRKFSRFEQVQVKTPLDSDDSFRPGTMVNVNAGIQYLGLRSLTPQFQLNAKIEGRDSGAAADIPNSGSTVVYASPGVTFKIAPQAQIYSFLQVPVYQDYNGLQLAPQATVSVGMVYAFY